MAQDCTIHKHCRRLDISLVTTDATFRRLPTEQATVKEAYIQSACAVGNFVCPCVCDRSAKHRHNGLAGVLSVSFQLINSRNITPNYGKWSVVTLFQDAAVQTAQKFSAHY